jgi:protease-4
MGSALPAPSGNWLVVDVDGDVPERGHAGYGARALGLLDLLRCLDAAAADDAIEGVLVRFRGELGSWSQALSLRRGLSSFRESGKGVAVWAESLSAEQFLVASAATRIWLPESGSLFLVGLRTERFFVRDLLDKLGAKPEVVHIGKFKSAGEGFTRGSMSDEEREQIEGWQKDLFDELVAGIADGRGQEEAAIRELIDRGPYSATTAMEAGLIDDLVYTDELELRLEALARDPEPRRTAARRAQLVPVLDYFVARSPDSGWQPLLRELPRLVYLLASGSITRGSGMRGITSAGTGELLDSLRTQRHVRGVLLRIDSPGGDALASDLLHRKLERLALEKPVVVSMGDVAASGGYYLAAAADAIHAEVGTITGSIGVVGGKLNLAGLYEKLGVAKDGVQQGARAGLLSEARGFSADERNAVRGEMEAIYETFLDRVGSGRKLSRQALSKIARGRIWSGRRAQAVGLVDAIGGPLEALRDLQERAGLYRDERFALTTLPRAGLLSGLTAPLLGGAQLQSRARTQRGRLMGLYGPTGW